MTMLDIGGGFPGRDEEDNHKLLTDMAAEIRKGLKKYSCFSNWKIISELGNSVTPMFIASIVYIM